MDGFGTYHTIVSASGEKALSIIQENGENNKKTIELKTYKNENFLIAEFKDNGIGILSTIKDKIFQPLFTPREQA